MEIENQTLGLKPICVECKYHVPCMDTQCVSFMCNIDKRCFRTEPNRKDCPLYVYVKVK